MKGLLTAGRLLLSLVVLIAGLFVAPAAAADTIDTDSRKAVADAYTNWLLPALDTPSGWTGDPKKCQDGEPEAQPKQAVGEESKASRKATFAAINYYRAMAGLQPVTENTSYSALARQAALIMLANDDLTHEPDPSWECYSEQGADAAARSNIAISWGSADGASARSIALYMDDPYVGNEEVGHRRWLLYPPASEFGTGSTNRTNAVLVNGEEAEQANSRPDGGTAWPSAGYFPWEAMPTSRRWSYGLPDEACKGSGAEWCANATVTMTRNGAPLKIDNLINSGDYIGDPALVWETAKLTAPKPGAVDTYRVTIKGVSSDPISYEVKVFRVTPEDLSTTPKPKITGTVKVGKTLTAKAGKWKPTGVKLVYQWYRGSTKIVGATKSTYTLVPKDKGKKITVKVTGTKDGYAKTTKKSKATKKVAAGTLSIPKPKIDGLTKVGKTLTVKAVAVRGGSAIVMSYQWYRGKKKISKATGPTYTLTAKDKGKKIKLKVTGKAPGYATRSASSKPTKKVG